MTVGATVSVRYRVENQTFRRPLCSTPPGRSSSGAPARIDSRAWDVIRSTFIAVPPSIASAFGGVAQERRVERRSRCQPASQTGSRSRRSI